MTDTPARDNQSGVESRTAERSEQDARDAGSRRIAVYKLTRALRDFGWVPVAAETGHGARKAEEGTWTSPAGLARLALRGPADEVPAQLLRLEITGGLDAARPWRLSGVWLPDLVPALLAASPRGPRPTRSPPCKATGGANTTSAARPARSTTSAGSSAKAPNAA